MPDTHVLVSLPASEAHKQQLMTAAPAFTYRWTTEETVTEDEACWADVILGGVPVPLVRQNRHLVWYQSSFAGPDLYLVPGVLPEGCRITNATGAYGLAIAEWMLGMWLALGKDLCLYRDNQRMGLWQPIARPVKAIAGAKVVCVGLGDIGCNFALRANALGAHVIGVRRRGGACPAYCKEVIPQSRLDEVLPEADLVALSLPETPETYHLLDADRIAKIKPGAILINVGRGATVDTGALCAALQAGRIFGAALDVTDPEPLPPGHPLWALPNVLITPHISGRFSLPATLDRIVDIFAHNLSLFAAGKPLDNLIDRTTHYVSEGGRLNSACTD